MSTDLLRWLYQIPGFLLLAGAIVLLVRCRRRSRRASRLGLVALSGLVAGRLVWAAVWATMDLWFPSVPREWREPAIVGLVGLQYAWDSGCVLLLTWAVVADRPTGSLVGAEADYVDAARSGAVPDPRR